MATLGQTIRARRVELGMTQEHLASLVGVRMRQAEISRLEHDRITLPRRERLERIAEALHLPVGQLLAASGWTGADATIGAGRSSSGRDDDQPVALEQVLEEAKVVVSHLQELVDVAETTLPDE